MYPNLRYALYDLFGIDLPFLSLVQTYGFFLAITFIACGWALWSELRRREQLGLLTGLEESMVKGKSLQPLELISNALLGFILGFKGIFAAQNPDLFMGAQAKQYLFSLDHGNWLMGLLLAIVFVALRIRDKKKERLEYPEETTITKLILPHERVSDIVVIAAISGVLGAKLLYMSERSYNNLDEVWADFFSGSGLSVFGGFILAFFVVSYYLKKKQLPLNQMIDACAPAMILGTGLGRLACHFSGDGDWGDPNPYAKPFTWIPDWLWAYKYPNNVMKSDSRMVDCFYPPDFGDYCYELSQGVFPTPVYEIIICLLIFSLLWTLRHKVKTNGLIFSIYLVLTGVQRFLLEMIRVNDDYQIAGFSLSQAQYIALILIAIGLITIIYLKSRKSSTS